MGNDLVSLRAHRAAPAGLAEELAEVVRGEVRFGPGDRALYATDASNYRQAPIGVVLPRDAEDVVRATEVCARHDVPILSRGGGTSLAGQCCNHAVVMDFSKHVRGVVDLDVERRLVRVLPGTVLDLLNEELRAHDLVFAPDPSTHNHCTIGGMIGNDSCGVHAFQSEFYGPGPRTWHHVRELEVLTYDGLRMRVGPTSDEEHARIVRAGGRRAEIYERLRALRDRHADAIRARFPDIPRRVSGYALPALLPEHGFDVARLLVGSEATLVTVLEATLELSPRFAHTALVLLGFETVADAGDAVARVRELDPKPTGCEGMDRMLVDFMREKGLEDGLDLLPEGGGWLLIELGADTEEEARAQAEAARAALAIDGVSARVCTDPAEQETVWKVRKAGLGVTAFVPGRPDAWEGWEDAAVPPERVGDYLRAFQALLDRRSMSASLYGHFGQGCIHTRLPFDLQSREGIDEYLRFTEEAADLVVSMGGSLSGEHGDGQSRGELLPRMYGDEIVAAFRELKAIFDPRGRMNPGKVIDAAPRDANLRLGADYHPWEPPTRLAFEADEGRFSRAALRCVGVGECRKEGDGTMCPSYMVTREEKHSTRGRAHLLFEMVRGELLDDGWRSREVHDALELCLSCKACKAECPVDVDMASYKSEFLSHYYEGRLRPRHAYAFGLIDRWARIGRALPGLSNFVTSAPGLRSIARWAGHIARERDFPRFARRTFRAWFADRASPAHGRPVVLWPDTFNDHFSPRVLVAAVEVLEASGARVELPPSGLCCGRPLYDYGMLDRAGRYWDTILDAMEPVLARDVPVIGVEPSCVAAFRDELLALRAHDPRAKRLSERVVTLGAYLDRLESWAPPPLDGRALFHAHCHHEAIMGVQPERRVLERLGLDVRSPNAGCCGMAGPFGYQAHTYEVSRDAAERVLLPAVRAARDEDLLVADGFSCRGQIEQLGGREALHLGQVLELAIAGARLTPGVRPERILARDPALEPADESAAAAAAVVGTLAAGAGAGYWLFELLQGLGGA